MGYAVMNAYAQPNSAVSPAAQTVTKVASALMKSAEDTQSIFKDQINAISQLRAVANECNIEDWDAYGAQPLIQPPY